MTRSPVSRSFGLPHHVLMLRIKFPTFLAVLTAVSLSTQLLGAQDRPSNSNVRGFGTIDGMVSDTGLVPLRGAFVSVLGTALRIGTGPNGRFRITKVPAGQYLVIVKRVGYRPNSGVIAVPADDTLRLSYTLEPIPTQLAAVVVTEKPFSLRMSEFLTRRRAGFGEFMTQEEIEAKNTVFSTELLRRFMSINVSPDRGSVMTQWYALSRREGANPMVGACPMSVFLDQIPLPTPFNLDLLPPPKDLAGIEVYAGASTIPPQFAGFNRGCGVILIWTKDGSPGGR
jgi:CarboxypepD_reg-like domain